MHTANREKPLPQNSAVSRQVYVRALPVQHLYSQWWDSKFFKRRGSLTPRLTNNRFSTTWEPLT